MTDLQKEKILIQTRTICASKEFNAKKKLCKLFIYIVDKALEGDEGSLKGYSIGLEVFNRPKDFKPEDDPIVRIQVGRLRRSLELYYLKEGANDKIRITIPKGANIPKFIPNEVIKQSAPKEISKISAGMKKPTIAVLPFKNLTGDPEKDYFVTGFTEEFLIELTHYEDFQIVSCRPKSAIGEKLYTSADFIEKLGAHFVIEGSIRINESMIKISVKLTDTFTKEHIWGEQYRRDLSVVGIIELQENIAQQIVALIAGEYGLIHQIFSKKLSKINPREMETYSAILRYYHHESQRTTETAYEAFKSLKQAIIKDPACGIASSMLASLYGSEYMLIQPDSENAVEKMIELAKKGIDLDPNNQLVRIIYAWTFFVQENKERFFMEMQKAFELNPNSPLRIGSIGFFLSLYGEWEKGKSLLDRAMKYNIGFPKWYYAVTTLYYYRLNNYEKAYEEVLQYDIPGLFWCPMLRAACLGQLNRIDEARKNIADLQKTRPDFKTNAEELIRRYIKEESLFHKIIEGLKKAGLEV